MKDHRHQLTPRSHSSILYSPSSSSLSSLSPSPLTSPSPSPTKPLKVTKKSLASEFTTVSDDLLTESITESFNFGPLSDVLCDNLHSDDSPESFNGYPPSTLHSPFSSESFGSILTAENHTVTPLYSSPTPSNSPNITSLTLTNSSNAYKSNSSKEEASITNNNLKKAMLLEALIEVSAREFRSLPKERRKRNEVVVKRGRINVFYVVALLMICFALMVFFLVGGSGGRRSQIYFPPPT